MKRLSLALLAASVLVGCGMDAGIGTDLPQSRTSQMAIRGASVPGLGDQHPDDRTLDAAGTAPGEILIKLESSLTPTRLALASRIPGFRFKAMPDGGLARLGWHLAEFDAARTRLDRVLEDLSKQPGVARAEGNAVFAFPPIRAASRVGSARPVRGYDDPLAFEQWALSVLNLEDAHAVNTGSDRILLAIVDTGIDEGHPDFLTRDGKSSRVVPGKNFADDGDTLDRVGHGTHCAGIAAATANNHEGVVGVAPGVRVLNVKVLGNTGTGSAAGVAAGIVCAADRGAQVISLSLGGRTYSQAVADAVNHAFSRDAVVVAAMGNDGDSAKHYPAALEGVVGVGSTGPSDVGSDFSSFGSWISVAAPGEAIYSTLPTYGSLVGKRNYGFLTGTSMATPAVAGLAALIRSQYPTWDRLAVRRRIERSAVDLDAPGFDDRTGYGRIDAARTLRGT